jgi:hypothetical protein
MIEGRERSANISHMPLSRIGWRVTRLLDGFLAIPFLGDGTEFGSKPRNAQA